MKIVLTKDELALVAKLYPNMTVIEFIKMVTK